MFTLSSWRRGQFASTLLLTLFVPAGALAAHRPADPAAALRPAGIQYLSPLPGSGLHPPASTIAIRPGGMPVSPRALDPGRWSVSGNVSGRHEGTLSIAPDARTVIFRPVVPFTPGERVTVAIARGLSPEDAGDLPSLTWWFDVRRGDDATLRALAARVAREGELGAAASAGGPVRPARPGSAAPVTRPLDQPLLPGDYVPVSVLGSDRPDSVGGIYLSPFNNVFPRRGRLLVVDHRGQPLFYRSLPRFAFDFRRQPDGLLTFWNEDGLYEAMDSTCAVVDTFRCGNGYYTDQHELQVLPNGHALLMAYDPEPYPMDTVVAGGRADAVVMGLILQEIDEEKNVVFQWRSWDHFQVTDLVECASHLTDSLVDYVHGNAIEQDADGNVLLSSRHLSEITKIDRQTGDILWRMGLNAKNNDFTFLDEGIGFSHQHDVRRLPNGHLSLFDNGNCVSTYSRAVEYEVDELGMTARLVAETRNVPVFTGFMGSRQIHADGSLTVGWGGSFTTDPEVTEYHPDGSLALALRIGSGFDWSYRALRCPWTDTAIQTDGEVAFGEVGVGEEKLQPLLVRNGLSTVLHVNQFVTTDPAFEVAGPDSLVLFPGTSGTLRVRFAPTHGGISEADLYVRSVNDTELVARSVHLVGSGTGVVGVVEGAATTLALRPPVPNPAHEKTSLGFDLPRATDLSLEVFDVRGRRVADLVEGIQAAGRHAVTWSTRGRSAGVYFVRMRADGRTFNRRMIVAR